MIETDCCGEKLVLFSEKALFWQADSALIVADLHLGKPAAFRKSGIGVPELTTGADLQRISNLIKLTEARRLIVLGDLLHAQAGMQDEMIESVRHWRAKNEKLEIMLVPGNHDRKCEPPPVAWNVRNVESEWRCGPFLFSHEPREHEAAYGMCGHVHPALVLREEFGPGIRAACFWFGKKRAVLPAFGSFTGMSNIRPVHGDKIFAIGNCQVVRVK